MQLHKIVITLNIELCDEYASAVGSGGRHSQYNLAIEGAPEGSTSKLGHFLHDEGKIADLTLDF